MSSSPDLRGPERKLLDEQIAAEPLLPIPELPADAKPKTMEEHRSGLQRRPVALFGIVENGMIRLLHPHVTLPEQARVIVVAPDSPGA